MASCWRDGLHDIAGNFCNDEKIQYTISTGGDVNILINQKTVGNQKNGVKQLKRFPIECNQD